MRILLAEDENDLNNIISRSLTAEQYSVDCCFDGEEAIDYINAVEYDLIILDIMMPKKNGLEVLKYIRNNKITTPVIFLTAKDSTEDKVVGLDLGANDYLTKPFALDELLARIRVLTRNVSSDNSNILKCSDLELNVKTHIVKRDGKNIDLSSKEYQLLEYLMYNQDMILSRTKIENHIWNFDYEGGTNVVDVYIRYLRQKIDNDYEHKLIHTKRGMGYMLTGDQT